jgi:AmmeMemoRadiSam system protein B/AmmeMemoRadiSam system protein A
MNIPGMILSIIGLSAVCAFGASAATRPPAVAGMFYPGDKTDLTKMVTGYLQNVQGLPDIDGQIIAIIVPHAGLVYSGPIAAYSYKLLENSHINKVILCGPSHRYRFQGISVYGPDVEWSTPLGLVPCNNKICQAMLAASKDIQEIPEAHQQEHCLEVQLPFLQTVLHDFTIAPAIMGYPDHQAIKTLADALSQVPFDDSTIMIASTDWQHYMPAKEGWKYDSLGLECLEDFDPARLEKYLAQDKTQMCGGGTAVAVLEAARAKGADKVKVLKYGDSGDVTGDKSSVVSYVAAVVYKVNDPADKSTTPKKAEKTSAKDLPPKMNLTDADKAKLLEIARETLEKYLSAGETPGFDVSDNLKQPGAAFVTLTKHEQLRGCIGQTIAVQPLYKTVSYCAIQAAVADPRFPPVTRDELDALDIEISVLTPLQKVNSLDEIEVGRDGLMISRGPYRGLLLPQVATEYNWDRTTFLQQTCRKAGLPSDAYQKSDAELFKFQAIIFHEPDK